MPELTEDLGETLKKLPLQERLDLLVSFLVEGVLDPEDERAEDAIAIVAGWAPGRSLESDPRPVLVHQVLVKLTEVFWTSQTEAAEKYLALLGLTSRYDIHMRALEDLVARFSVGVEARRPTEQEVLDAIGKASEIQGEFEDLIKSGLPEEEPHEG